MTRYEDEPRPQEPLAQVDLVVPPDALTIVSLSLDAPTLAPGREAAETQTRTLHVRDQRSGLTILTVRLDSVGIVELLGGQSAKGAAFLIPRPQRDFLGRFRVALTVRVSPDYLGRDMGAEQLQKWIAWGRERLETLGLVDYEQCDGVDLSGGEEEPALVCTFLLYPHDARRPDDDERRGLRAMLVTAARSFGLPLVASEAAVA